MCVEKGVVCFGVAWCVVQKMVCFMLWRCGVTLAPTALHLLRPSQHKTVMIVGLFW